MKVSLIICTYLRPKPLLSLLETVKCQTKYPHEILIIDGSTNVDTEEMLIKNKLDNLKYFKVDDTNRGLTKQRNFGISKVDSSVDVVCFLDDDVLLEKAYFEEICIGYRTYPNALAVGGYITNQVKWSPTDGKNRKTKFYFDGWMRDEPLRFKVRRPLGLLPETKPGMLSSYSHGRSVSFLPPSGKIYEVQQIMGGAASYKRTIFDALRFSSYFEGYGLYEDVDFSIRLSRLGKLYVNTKAQLEHHHNPSGRPNHFKYGKMVVRNGWYVWRLSNPKPSFTQQWKWLTISLVLIGIRFLNGFHPKNFVKAFTDAVGRCAGLFSLMTNKPKIAD